MNIAAVTRILDPSSEHAETGGDSTTGNFPCAPSDRVWTYSYIFHINFKRSCSKASFGGNSQIGNTQ